jgi:hypothetical protein
MAGQVQKTASVMTCVRNGYTTTPSDYAVGGPGPSPSYNNSIYMTFPDLDLPTGAVIDSASMHYDMTSWDWSAATSIELQHATGAGTPTNQVGVDGTLDSTTVPSSTLTDTYEATNTARRMLETGLHYLKMFNGNGENRKNFTSTKAILTVNYTAPPVAPTLGSVVRDSPTQCTVNWTNNATTDAPYTTLAVYRAEQGSSFFALLATKSPTTLTQHVDTTCEAGKSYRYQVMASNAAGDATSAASSWLYAVPTAPSSVANHRESTTSNHVTWTDNPTTGAPYDHLEVERTTNGTDWTSVNSSVSGTATSLIDSASVSDTVGYKYRVRAVGPGGTSDYGTAADYTEVKPAAPTIGTATRVSDTQATIAWTNSGAAGPYEALTVERQTDGESWVQVASVATTATSYTDTTVAANHSYAYRVKAANTAGSATSAASSTIYNTPAAPTIGTATKTGDTAVTVTWTDNSNTESNFEVQRSVDGGAYSAIGTVGAGVTSYNDTSAPGGTLTYKVRAYRGSLYSALSAASNSVTTTQPPAAPTITPAWPAYSPTGATLRVSWQHNTLDGSAQSSADVVYNIGAGDVTQNVAGATSYYDISITGKLATQVCTVKVRTYGLHASPGSYSATQSTTLADQPACNITTPATDGTTVTDAPLAVAWSYTDEFAQAGWALQLLSAGGAVLKTWTGATETSKSIPAADLPDDSSYSLALEVRSGSGFTAAATRTFGTDYAGPTAPTIAATFDPVALSASIIAAAGETGALPATDHLVLLRIDSHLGVTEQVTLADPFTSGSYLTDYVPRLDQTVTYRVLAVAANGAYSLAEAQISTPANGAVALNFGEGYAQLLILQWDAQVGRDREDDSETFVFAGRPDPVTYAGEHTKEVLSVTATVLDATNAAALEALGLWHRACTYRQPGGRRIHVKVQKIGDSLGEAPGATGASLSLLKVE